jgi:capsular exopolysaccharide synthesis family protein
VQISPPTPPSAPPDDAADPRTLLEAVWRRRWLMIGFVATITVATYLVSKAITKQYQGKAQVQVEAGTLDTRLFGGDQSSSASLAQSLAQAQLTATTPRVAVLAARRLQSPPANPQSLLDHVHVSGDEDAGFLTIKAKDPAPRRAAALANAFAGAVIALRTARARGEIDRSIAQLLKAEKALPRGDDRDRRDIASEIRQLRGFRASQAFVDQLVQPALIPKAPTSPHPARNTAVAFLLAVLLALGLAYLLERLDRTVDDSDEVPGLAGAPLLGEIPPAAAAGLQPAGEVDEAFQMLRANLTYFDIDRRLDSVLVASPLQGDGKTTVALGLARAAAEAGKDVFLVDTDLRHPPIGPPIGPGTDGGLGAVLVGEVALEDAISETHVGEGRLRILPSGPAAPNPAALIGSDAMRDLLGDLTGDADLVVIDTPPLLGVSDAIPLLELVSGTILVARRRWTTRHAVRRTHELISNTRGSLLGAVVTDAEPSGLAGYRQYVADGSPRNGQVPVGRPSRARRWLRALR